MARKERTSKGKTMRPNYFVFCEGETEVAYTEMLRTRYRLPIHIIAKKTCMHVTPALVERCKAFYVQTKDDKTYLMYDLDVAGVLEKLQKVPEAILLCSNPCFELWLLLHYIAQRGALTSDACVSKLKKHVPQYRKGVLSAEVQAWLMEHVGEASRRAQQLEAYGNPCTNIYQLVEELESLCMTHQH
ncbi:MAG: RloB domain-containing protein [Bacteroidales bacterium]|nr:RloB domain-containing protein [Bacteroidales bacterium]